MSMIVRPVSLNDIEDLYELALGSGFGITTFPKNKKILTERVHKSIASFNHQIKPTEETYYFFVLEDTAIQKIVGTSAIEGKTGVHRPFYSFEYQKKIKKNQDLSLESTHEYLIPSCKNNHCTELCTLYLHPKYRKDGNGLLLSKARFFYLYYHQQDFSEYVIAELRGVLDASGRSLFWEKVMQPFFNMPFKTADELTLSSDKSFIQDLMPDYPIYLNFFSNQIRSIIGQPHPDSRPAYHILEKEGFQFNQTVDIFDAGPTLIAPLLNIKTIQLIQQYPFEATQTLSHPQKILLCNPSDPFRVTCDLMSFSDNQCYLLDSTIQNLNLSQGDKVSVVIST